MVVNNIEKNSNKAIGNKFIDKLFELLKMLPIALDKTISKNTTSREDKKNAYKPYKSVSKI